MEPEAKQLTDTADSARYRELLYALEQESGGRAFRLELELTGAPSIRVIATASNVVSEANIARIAGRAIAETLGLLAEAAGAPLPEVST